MKSVSILVVLLFLGGVFMVAIQFDRPPAETAKSYFFEHGSAETDAINLVTAIYLGYRAFDTLGETVVLLLSFAGAIFFLEKQTAFTDS